MGILQTLFGGSKQKSTSSQESFSSSANQAYPLAKEYFGQPGADFYGTAGREVSRNLFGGFDNYKANTGYDFLAGEGMRGIGGQYAGKGAFQSGAMARDLAKYQGGLAQTTYGSYMDNLFKQAQLGAQGGQLAVGAGGTATSTSSGYGTSSGNSSPGIGGFLGSIIGGIASSDRRLKKNIHKVGQLANGLNVYQYRYINDAGPYVGVMADEVAKIQPEALGPVIDGYATVNYDKIEKELV